MTTKKQKLPATTEPATALSERREKAALVPRCKDNNLNITEGLQADYVVTMFNTCDKGLIHDVIRKSVCGEPITNSDKAIDNVLMHFAELRPESYLETLLISQMLQVHNAAANCTQRAFHADQTFAGKELNANLAIKMHRTFLAQIEALQKLRGKGGQKVTVEHVTVNAGGQAIVGNVEQRQRGEG